MPSMRFSSNLIAAAAAAAATSSFSSVVSVVAVATEDDSHSTRRVRGGTAAKKLNSLLEFQEETESNESSLFWNRNLEMYMSVEDDHDHDDDHDANSSSDKDDVDACPSTPDPVDPEVVRAALRTFVDTLDDSPLLTDFSPHDEPGPSQYARAYHPNPEDQAKDYHLCTIVQQCLDPDFILAFGHMSAKSRGLAFNAASAAMSTESFLMLQLQEHSNMVRTVTRTVINCVAPVYYSRRQNGRNLRMVYTHKSIINILLFYFRLFYSPCLIFNLVSYNNTISFSSLRFVSFRFVSFLFMQ